MEQMDEIDQVEHNQDGGQHPQLGGSGSNAGSRFDREATILNEALTQNPELAIHAVEIEQGFNSDQHEIEINLPLNVHDSIKFRVPYPENLYQRDNNTPLDGNNLNISNQSSQEINA